MNDAMFSLHPRERLWGQNGGGTRKKVREATLSWGTGRERTGKRPQMAISVSTNSKIIAFNRKNQKEKTEKMKKKTTNMSWK